MGYSGNPEPSFIVPTQIATIVEKQGAYVQDLDFFIGAEAVQKRADYNIDYPIKEGAVNNWDNMEKYWQRCIYQYLCCDPEEHNFMLVIAELFLLFLTPFQTEPPMNTPENREFTAEVRLLVLSPFQLRHRLCSKPSTCLACTLPSKLSSRFTAHLLAPSKVITSFPQ